MSNIQKSQSKSKKAKYRLNSDAVAQRVGNEIVLVNMQTERIFELNRTGARLWELLGENCDRAKLVQQMLQEFDVEESKLNEEIDSILSSLIAEGFLESQE